MSDCSCQVRNLRSEALSGFFQEKDALAAGGHYVHPGDDGYVDAAGKTGLCVVCENCGSVVEVVQDEETLSCPDCGETSFRVFQTFRLMTIARGFTAQWHVAGLSVAINVPQSARAGMMGIHYTVDGSDPVLSSPLYEGPISFRKSFKPLRAAVFYSDSRSQIIEWDYGRAERNRREIQKTSNHSPAPHPKRVEPRTTSKPPLRTRPASAPVPSEVPEGNNKGRGCLFWIGVAGAVLLYNDITTPGWILLGMAILGGIGILTDDKGKS